MSLRTISRHLLLLTSLVPLSACSALRIDVDVYKGPLVNTESTYFPQAAATAMAAKPLLIELRDKLLGRPSDNWLLPDDKIVRSQYPMVKEEALAAARKVNAVLGLYADSQVGELPHLDGEANSKFLEASENLLRVLEQRGTKRAWEEAVRNFATIGKVSLEQRSIPLQEMALVDGPLLDVLSRLVPKDSPLSVGRLEATPGDRQREKIRKGAEALNVEDIKVPPIPSDKHSLEELKVRVSTLIHYLYTPLDGGRRPEGLQTLIQRTLIEHDPSARKMRELDTTRTLIDFGTKCLIVGDFSFFDRQRRFLFVSIDRPYAEYRLLLQAIGNSLISLCDQIQAQLAGGRPDARTTESLRSLVADEKSQGGRTKLLGKSRGQTSAEIWNEVMDMLRVELVTLQKNGADSARIKSIEAALLSAQEARERSIHILPAVAYLRTTAPVSIATSGQISDWSNMLDQQADRALFGIQSLFRKGGLPESVFELDSQYWHPVNTVRVTGAGNTNYALMQDDVGNWVTKNFGANTDEIIKAAKRAALFAANGAVSGMDLAKATLSTKTADLIDETDDSADLKKVSTEAAEANKALEGLNAANAPTTDEPLPEMKPVDVPLFTKQANGLELWYSNETTPVLQDLADGEALRVAVTDGWSGLKIEDKSLSDGVLTTLRTELEAINYDVAAPKSGTASASAEKQELITFGDFARGLSTALKFEEEVLEKLNAKAMRSRLAIAAEAEGKLKDVTDALANANKVAAEKKTASEVANKDVAALPPGMKEMTQAGVDDLKGKEASAGKKQSNAETALNNAKAENVENEKELEKLKMAAPPDPEAISTQESKIAKQGKKVEDCQTALETAKSDEARATKDREEAEESLKKLNTAKQAKQNLEAATEAASEAESERDKKAKEVSETTAIINLQQAAVKSFRQSFAKWLDSICTRQLETLRAAQGRANALVSPIVSTKTGM